VFDTIRSWWRGVPKHEVKEVEWGRRIAKALTTYGLATRDEVRIFDGTRIDLLTPHHAVEIDWAPKWAEAIGQSLYYGVRSKKQAVVLLLLCDSRDEAYIVRCRAVCTTNTPKIPIWLLNTKSRVLYLADGQTITVE